MENADPKINSLGMVECVEIYSSDIMPEKELMVHSRSGHLFLNLENQKDLDFLESKKKFELTGIDFIMGGSKDLKFYQDFVNEYFVWDPEWQKRLLKFKQIYDLIKAAGIKLSDVKSGNPVMVSDDVPGWKMEQNIIFWDTNEPNVVADAIIKSKKEYTT